MSDIDLKIIVIVIFWAGLWGAVQTIANWFFEQMGPENNYGTRFLSYMILAIGSFCVLNHLLKDGELEIDLNTNTDEEDTDEEDE